MYLFLAGFFCCAALYVVARLIVNWRVERAFKRMDAEMLQKFGDGHMHAAGSFRTTGTAPFSPAKSLISVLNQGAMYDFLTYFSGLDDQLRVRGMSLVGAELTIGESGFLGPGLRLHAQIQGAEPRLIIDSAAWRDGSKVATIEEIRELTMRHIAEINWVRPANDPAPDGGGS